NFALWSSSASSVQLCLFDESGAERRIELREKTHHVWHGYLPGVLAGTRYGFRVAGDPALRHDPAKLLLDPYARAIDGEFDPPGAVFAAGIDSAPYVPRSVVVASPGPVTERRPRIPWDQTVIYELHVRGFTRTHPDVPEAQRGTYAGLAHPAVIGY